MKITTDITVFSNRSKLSVKELDLLEIAHESAKRAYAPYSHFKVGTAILLQNGHIISGNNQENAVFPSGMCAERVALYYAGSQFPETPITCIAITAIGGKKTVEHPIPPCGGCRQALLEYELKFKNPIKVIMSGEIGEVFMVKSVGELLPLSFDSHFLY